jgi:RNA polymerase sigma-70 factor (ECF subfamily)
VRTATVKGYLLTITRNLHLQERRRTARHVALSVELPEPRPGPDLAAERSSELGSALADLQRLPEGERAAILMRAVEELSYERSRRALASRLAATKVRSTGRASALARMREART